MDALKKSTNKFRSMQKGHQREVSFSGKCGMHLGSQIHLRTVIPHFAATMAGSDLSKAE